MELSPSLLSKKCVPCEGGAPPLSKEQVATYLNLISNWQVDARGHLSRQFKFKNFLAAMEFVNKVAALAEKEGHHPDFTVHYNKVDFEIWTHAINGLSENDFILAAKIGALAS